MSCWHTWLLGNWCPRNIHISSIHQSVKILPNSLGGFWRPRKKNPTFWRGSVKIIIASSLGSIIDLKLHGRISFYGSLLLLKWLGCTNEKTSMKNLSKLEKLRYTMYGVFILLRVEKKWIPSPTNYRNVGKIDHIYIYFKMHLIYYLGRFLPSVAIFSFMQLSSQIIPWKSNIQITLQGTNIQTTLVIWKIIFKSALKGKKTSWWFQPIWKILVKLEIFPE